MAENILPIGMSEMNRIFDVVDALEISREAVQVELLPRDPGTIEKLPSGKVRIVLPASTPLEDWLPSLSRTLEELRVHDQGSEESGP